MSSIFRAGEVRNGAFLATASVLNSPIVDSARALFYASPTLPIDAAIPPRSRVSANAIDVCWADSSGRRNTASITTSPLSWCPAQPASVHHAANQCPQAKNSSVTAVTAVTADVWEQRPDLSRLFLRKSCWVDGTSERGVDRRARLDARRPRRLGLRRSTRVPAYVIRGPRIFANELPPPCKQQRPTGRAPVSERPKSR